MSSECMVQALPSKHCYWANIAKRRLYDRCREDPGILTSNGSSKLIAKFQLLRMMLAVWKMSQTVPEIGRADNRV